MVQLAQHAVKIVEDVIERDQYAEDAPLGVLCVKDIQKNSVSVALRREVNGKV
jgi:hypothetical protein